MSDTAMDPRIEWGTDEARVYVDPELEALLEEAERFNRAQQQSTEVRVVNPTTGGEKGSKLERFDLIPVEPLMELARHYGVGAKKYLPHNWRRGYDWSLSYAALQRHANRFWAGEDIDPETGTHHMAAVAFHAFALIEYGRIHPELDDRVRAEGDRA